MSTQAHWSEVEAAISTLRRFNKWRRGQVDDLPELPAQIGRALDIVCAAAEQCKKKGKKKGDKL
jgi:hypothetical protein